MKNGVDWINMTIVWYFSRVKKTVFQTYRHPKKWRKGFLSVVSLLPAHFFWIFLSNSINLLGPFHSLLEYFIDDIPIFDPNRGCSFNKGKNNPKRRNLLLIHKFRKLASRCLFDNMFDFLRNLIELCLIGTFKSEYSLYQSFSYLISSMLIFLLKCWISNPHIFPIN